MTENRSFRRSATGASILIVIILTSIGVYGNAIFNGFVVDDMHQVVENPWIRDVRYLKEIFSSNVWAFEGRDSNYYRPLMHVAYMGVYHLVGLRAWGFHLLNVLLHAGATALVFLIGSRLFGRSEGSGIHRIATPAFVAALLFATHPVHTEAVAWVAGVTDLSYSFFFLLSLYLYVRSDGDYGFCYMLSVAAFFIAALCKEPALTLPAALVLYDHARPGERTWSGRSVGRYVPYLGAAAGYLGLRWVALGGFAPFRAADAYVPSALWVNALVLFRQYLAMLLFPIELNNYHLFRPAASILTVTGILSAAVAVAALSLAGISARRNRLALFSIGVMALPLIPVLYVPALTQGGQNAFAERYLYLPSVGFVFLVGIFYQWLKERKPEAILPVVAVLSALIVLYAVGTIHRNGAWANSVTLWSDAVRKSPTSARAHENLGYALYYEGKAAEGKGHLVEAYRLAPDLVNEKIAKGIGYARKGFINNAIFQFNIALILKPDAFDARYNLGIAYEEKGWIDQAIQEYRIAVSLNPRFSDAHNNLGVAYSKKGSVDKAIEHFKEAVMQDPTDPSFRHNLANAYELKNLPARAEQERAVARSLENR